MVHFFVKTDEMLDEYINKSAPLAFYCGMITMGVGTLIAFVLNTQSLHIALTAGLTYGVKERLINVYYILKQLILLKFLSFFVIISITSKVKEFLMNIRYASIFDAPQIANIYKYYVENTHISFEYTAPSEKDFEKRIASTLKSYPYLVWEENNSILGYAYACEHISRAAYNWNAVLTVYLHKDCHSKGIGSSLYAKLFEILKAQNVKNVYGCITSGNEKSIAMHQKLGFEVNAVFHNTGFKNGHWLDVIWVEKQIGDYNTPPPQFIAFEKLQNKISYIL